MSGGRRTWVDAFDRVPVSYSASGDTPGAEKVQTGLRLHADRPPVRRRTPLALVRAVVTRLFANEPFRSRRQRIATVDDR
jgi:hypothetical protein